MKHARLSVLTLVGLLASLVLPSAASAAAPQFDTGKQIDSSEPYKDLPVVTDLFEKKALYGKLEGATPVDIYELRPDKDGEQTFSLLVPDNADASIAPFLIFVDPTDATEAASLNIPTPGEEYHAAVIEPVTEEQIHTEPMLGQQFKVIARQKVALAKDTTYYLVVLDQSGALKNYAIQFGEGSAWSFADVASNLGGWLKLKTDAYGESSPFVFKPATVGLLIFLIGFMVLFGTWFVEQTFAFLANRFKTAGYILIKFQPYGRVFTWASLWFGLLGGYIYLSKIGWIGLPFLLALAFVLLAIAQLVYTFTLSRSIGALEVSKQEATIPLAIRKWHYAYFAVSLFAFGSLLALLVMHLARI